MTSPEPHPEPPTSGSEVLMRASDLDRRRTAGLLHDALGRGQLSIAEFDERTAAAWAAVYRKDLEPLTRDLVDSTAELPARALDADVHPPASMRVTGDGGPSLSVALFSGFERTGVWTLPARYTAVAVMGGGSLDLRYANLGADHVTITAVAIMGGIEIIVPDDVAVRERGVGVMGAFVDERRWNGAPVAPPPGAPVITITGAAIMGGVSIVRKPAGPKKEVER